MKKKRFSIGFTCGVFDLTHAGHYLMFEECKKHCDYLIVGVQTDPTIDRPEKHRPIQGIYERVTQVQACKWVDKTIVYKTEHELYELLTYMKIDVRFVGDDWRGKGFTGHDLPIPIIYTGRDHGFSSSSIRERVYHAERRLRE